MALPDKIWVWDNSGVPVIARSVNHVDGDVEYIRNDPKVLLGEVRRRLAINCVNDMWHVWDVEDITPEDLEVKDG